MAIERLEYNLEYDAIELIGTDSLCEINETLKCAVSCNCLNNDCCFEKIFGLESNFFYTIETIENQQSCYYERGIASIIQENDKYFLNRKRVFVSGKSFVDNYVVSLEALPQIKFGKTLIYSSIPPTYLEALSAEHSVLCSSLSNLPHSVPLVENSLLARFDDSIESVSFSDDRLVSKIINIIATFGKQLKLKTSKLSLKRVEPEVIDLVPSSNVKAKRGSVYYDKDDNVLKFYDGERWNTLAFVKDES